MKTSYYIESINCPDCANCLVKNLHQIEYIKEEDINYDTKMVTIEGITDLTEKQIDLVLDTVARLSHCQKHQKSEVITEEFGFENIDCQNCALKVERALNKNVQIIDAKVNFITKKIIITHSNNVSIYETVCDITRHVEDGAIVTKDKDKKENKKVKVQQHHHHSDKPSFVKLNLIFFIIGLSFFFTALILQYLVNDINLWLYYSFYIASYIFISFDIIKKSIMNVSHGQIFDENFLMIVASCGALILQESFEAIIVVLLYKVGTYFEARAVNKSTTAITKMINIKVDHVTKENNEVIDIKDCLVGTNIIVHVGEVVPLDGIIIEGESSLDTSSLTGESLPKEVKENDLVLAGTINLTKAFKMKTTTVDADSTSSKVLKLVEEASIKKSKTEAFITNFARIYTPIILILALVVFFIEWLLLEMPINESLNNVFVFLVISCPCALVVSIPLGFFMGIGQASKQGILVKGGNYLEALTKTKVIVMDKTGTLTKGNFKIKEISPIEGISEEKLLSLIASVEAYSMHPIAKAIVDRAKENNLDITIKVTDIEELSGLGLKAKIDSKVVLVGNEELMIRNNIDYIKEECPGSCVYMALDKVFYGNVLVGDEIKEGVPNLIKELSNQHIKTVMLTGDNEEISKMVSEKLHLDEYHAGLLPNQKLTYLEDIIKNKAPNTSVLYVGDGINDTPCLKLAYVGIAMSGVGSSAAVEASDVVLMKDDICKLIFALKISKYTKKIVWENIIFALFVKIVALIIGATGLLGSYGMLLGVFSDVGVCIITVLNTIRIIKKH